MDANFLISDFKKYHNFTPLFGINLSFESSKPARSIIFL